MSRTYRLVVGPAEAHARLDRYLVRHVPQVLSRAAVQRAIEQGAVTVEGRLAKAHRSLKTGEQVVARFDQLGASSPSQKAMLRPENIPLEVVYEDAHLLVVNKPPGLVTHPAPGHWSGTLVNAILWHLQASGSKLQASGLNLQPAACGLQPALPRAGIVHRLDKDTSGLLVVAKTEQALYALAKQLKARTMSRRYVTLVEGHVPFDQGTVNASLGRHLRDRKLMAVRYLGGRQAVTHYRVIKRLQATGHKLQAKDQAIGHKLQATKHNLQPAACSLQPVLQPEAFPYTLLEVSLETGRTHQVRVHLAHLGHPVLGDATYSRQPASAWTARGISRQLLHAYAIRLAHPATAEPIALTARVPLDMAPWIPSDILERLNITFASRNLFKGLNTNKEDA